MLQLRLGTFRLVLLLVLLFPLIAVWTIDNDCGRYGSSTNLVHAASRGEDFISTREEILASRERRVKQIETLLEDSRQRFNDHKSGVRLLNDKELVDLQKKIDIYSRKLESMTAPLDEREIQRIIQREELQNERLKERRNAHQEL